MEVHAWTYKVLTLFSEPTDSNQLLSLLALTSGKSILDLSSFSKASKHYTNLKYAISSTIALPQEHNTTTQWFNFLSNHLLYLSAKANNSDPTAQFESFNQSFVFFTQLFMNLPEGKWSAGLVKWFCSELYRLAKNSDSDFEKAGKKPAHYDEAVRSIQQLFSKCQSSKQPFPHSKIYGVLYCINTLFKIFFRLDSIKMPENLLDWYGQNRGNVKLEEYPMSVQVTFNYYYGCMAFYKMNIQDAEKSLTFVVQNCHKDAIKNRMLALRYLVPARMLMGVYPTKELLEKYQLKEYIKISDAIRNGDVKSYNEELEKYEELYISKGVYLVMDKLKLIVYRNLFKKTVKIINPQDARLQMEYFDKALKWQSNEPIDILETECILANLIDKKMMKAYLMHQKENKEEKKEEKRLVVMSKKQEIFPNIKSLY